MRRATIALALITAAALGATACVKREVVPVAGSVGPTLVVEQFLRAANAKDLTRMGELFGTKDGPITSRDPRQQVEQRMFSLATVLRHDDFEIQSEQLVPGRTNEATRLIVKLTVDRATYHVPFTMVRYRADRWLVEQIGIEVITRRPS